MSGQPTDLAELERPILELEAQIRALEKKNIKPDSAEIAYVATQTHPITSLDAARSLLKLQEALEELDDVQNVFTNEEMDDALSEQAQAGL